MWTMLFLALLSLVRLTSAYDDNNILYKEPPPPPTVIWPKTTDVLVLGDSWAKHSLSYLADNCAGKTVFNGGIDKLTAVNWQRCIQDALNWGPMPPCPEAFQAAFMAKGLISKMGVKSVWFSIGGNDFIMGGCQSTAAEIAQLVARALIALRVAVAPPVNILMTGYCPPPHAIGQSCVSAAMTGTLNAGIKAACMGTAGCTFVDAISACGGGAAKYSDPKYFQDALHLNQAGYNALFQMPGVQTALSCGVAAAIPPVAQKYIEGDTVTSAGVARTPSSLVSSLFACALFAAGAFVVMYRMRRGHDSAGVDGDDAEAAEALPEE